MYEREEDLALYSQVNSMAAYINMIKFAMEKLELYVDEIGDEVFFRNESPFPKDVLGDDSLFHGYTNPWSPDDECKCDECRCSNDKDGNRVNRPESEEEYFNWIDSKRMSVGNIMDILNKTRKAPQDYRMD